MRSMTKMAIEELRSADKKKALFMTLTTHEILTGEECSKALNRFWVSFKRKYWVRDYIFVREIQERGAYHYHIIIFDITWLPVQELREIWTIGSVNLKPIYNFNKRYNYIIKEITKQGQARLHASIHLLDALGIRQMKRALKEFFSFVNWLRIRLLSKTISMATFDFLYRVVLT